MPDIIRVLLLDLSLRFGGTSSRVIGLLKHLPSGTAALAGLEKSPVSEQAKRIGIPVFTVGKSKLNPLIYGRLNRIVRQHGFQVLDTQNPQSKFWGYWTARHNRCALVSTLNSWYMFEHSGNAKGRLYQALEKLTSSRTDRFIAVSGEIRRALLLSGVSAARSALIRNGVELDASVIGGGDGWLKRKYRLSDNAVVCCAVGRLVAAKGLNYLVDAMSLIAPRYPKLICLIVGSGEKFLSLKQQIVRNGLQSRILLTGNCSHTDVLRILKNADYFVMPSISEAVPMALLEAGALAKPVAASRVGDIPIIITHRRNGLIFDPANASSIAAALAWLLEHPGEARKLGSRLKSSITSNFNITTQALAVHQAYRKAFRENSLRVLGSNRGCSAFGTNNRRSS